MIRFKIVLKARQLSVLVAFPAYKAERAAAYGMSMGLIVTFRGDKTAWVVDHVG